MWRWAMCCYGSATMMLPSPRSIVQSSSILIMPKATA